MFKDVESKLEPAKAAYEPLTDSDIAMIRAACAADLPTAYVTFLRTYGQCMFAEDAIVHTSDDRQFPIFTFFGKGQGSRSVLGDLAQHPEYAETQYLPIADDLFNNRYVLDLHSGRVLYIEYSNGRTNASQVAPDFKSLLDLIEVVPST
jgi:SMI1/KNR4 family protein SUKH-1